MNSSPELTARTCTTYTYTIYFKYRSVVKYSRTNSIGISNSIIVFKDGKKIINENVEYYLNYTQITSKAVACTTDGSKMETSLV